MTRDFILDIQSLEVIEVNTMLPFL